MSILNYFGIYEGSIERADEVCTDTLKNFGASDSEIDEVYEGAYYTFYSSDLYENVTNVLIRCMFLSVQEWIEENFNSDCELEIEIFVNGMDSNIYVNHEDARTFDTKKF